MLKISIIRPVLSTLLTVSAVALIAAGCGSETTSSSASDSAESTPAAASEGGGDGEQTDPVLTAYADGMVEVGDNLTAAGDRFSSASDFKTFAVATKSLNGVISHANGLTPPESVATLHGELIASLKDVRAAARKITETSTEASDNAQIAIIDEEFTQMGTTVDAIFAELS